MRCLNPRVKMGGLKQAMWPLPCSFLMKNIRLLVIKLRLLVSPLAALPFSVFTFWNLKYSLENLLFSD